MEINKDNIKEITNLAKKDIEEPINTQEVIIPITNDTKVEESKDIEVANTKEIQKREYNFKPGVSGNPKGKPKGARHFSTLIREAIKAVAEGDSEPQDILMVKALAKKAKAGDLKALDMVFDRVDGKAEQTINLDGEMTINDGLTQEEKEALLSLIK